MPRQEFRHDRPDRCVVGTVGEPGQRIFFLQARSGSRLTSVVLEKAQVAALADRLEAMLDEVVRRGGTAESPRDAGVEDLAPLDVPLEEEFRVGTLSLAWEPARGEVELVASALVASDAASAHADASADADADDAAGDDGDDDADRLVVRLTSAAARGFVRRARAVVAAGRPPCPLCAQPLDPSGHVCPRQNGFHRRP